jgi:signal transduction histidine kinase
VSDDGQGFDTTAQPGSESSYGMRSMAERAELVGGRVAVTSRPGLGTSVTVTVPVKPA